MYVEMFTHSLSTKYLAYHDGVSEIRKEKSCVHNDRGKCILYNYSFPASNFRLGDNFYAVGSSLDF